MSLSLSLSELHSTMNINERKKPIVVTHLCSIPLFSGSWCVWIQSRLTSCLSFSILLSHVGKILVLTCGILQTFQDQLTFSNPVGRLDVSSSCSSELIKSPEEHTLSSFDEVRPQRISEILDFIGGSHRFTVKKSLVHFCVSDNSVFQHWTSFFCFSCTVRSNQ